MKFRADIEGLRGIAVFGVVLYHFKFGIAPGGFVGVDIFFVISGFLITGILYREVVEDGSVLLADFWARRVRRILPAATVVLLISTLGVFLFAVSVDIRGFASDIVAAAAFLLNWRLAAKAVDYLAPHDVPSVVLHYWSLAVEEQFYVCWPILIAGVVWLKRFIGRACIGPVLKITTGALWIISFAAGVYFTQKNAPFAFFGSVPRAWQLLTGAMLVFAVVEKSSWLFRLLPVFGWTGLAAVLAGICFYSTGSSYPGWLALLPTLGAAGLIVSETYAGWGPARVLANAPLRFVGRISYSWYLWHWPFAWFGAIFDPNPNFITRISLLAGSFLAGAASYYFVENPVRFSRILTRSAPISLTAGALMLSLSAGAALTLRWAYLDRPLIVSSGKRISLNEILSNMPRLYTDGCHLDQMVESGPPCVFGDTAATKTVVLFGDSHAAQYFPALDVAARQLGWRIVVRTKSACPPTDAPIWNALLKRAYSECTNWHERVLGEIAASRPDLVLLASKSDFQVAAPGNNRPLNPAASEAILAAGERRMSEKLLRYAGALVVIRDTPRFGQSPLRCLALNPGNDKVCTWRAESILRVPRVPTGIEPGPRIRIVDLVPKLCPDGICLAVREGIVVFRDDNHLTATAAAKFLEPAFAEMLKITQATH